jgi:hypothetical protein
MYDISWLDMKEKLKFKLKCMLNKLSTIESLKAELQILKIQVTDYDPIYMDKQFNREPIVLKKITKDTKNCNIKQK